MNYEHTTPHRKLFCLLLSIFFLLPINAQSELEFCTEPEWTEKTYLEMLSHVPYIREYNTPENSDLYYIPVVFFVYRDDEGNIAINGNPVNINQTVVDSAISKLNQVYGSSKLRFYQWGTTHYIDNDFLYEPFQNWNSNMWVWPELELGGFRSDIGHIPNAVTVHIRSGSVGGSSQPTSPPPNQTISLRHDFLASHIVPSFIPYNLVFPHEMGHVFGLLHTHGSPQEFDWDVLSYTTIIDHPYYGTLPRELYIRDTAIGKPFSYPNCETAGDFICDTHPDCHDNLNFAWPHFPCVNPPYGCDDGCKNGTAIDYNSDLIEDQVNLMSYHWNSTHLTNGQIHRMHYMYDSFRVHQFDTSIHVNFRDYVEFEDTEIGLRSVIVRPRHASDSLNFTNTITNKDGFFFGALFDTLLNASVFTLGSGDSLHYNVQDWLAGVTMEDMFLIQKHILGTEPLNGYRQLAADVNGSGSVTTLDMKFIKGLLLDIYDEFPHPVAQPWIFVPEFVPHELDSLFHDDPFNLTINGVSYIDEAPYIYPSWEYVITDGLNGSAGFDGVKLGDVNGSVLETDSLDFTCGNELNAQYASHFFEEDEYYNLSFSLESSSDLVALQMGFALDSAYFVWEEWGDMEGEQILLTSEDVSYSVADSGIRAVWFSSTGTAVDFSSGRTLFNIVVKATSTFSSSFSSGLYLSSNHLMSAAYNEFGCRLPLDVDIDVEHLENRSLRAGQTQQTNSIKVGFYPNPIRGDIGHLVLFQEHASALDVQLIDTHGRNVRYWHVETFHGGNEQELNGFSEVSSGLHFLIIRNEGEVIATHKIIVP